MAERFLTLDEAAEIAHVSKITLRRAITACELDGFKPGKCVLVKESELEGWVESRRILPAAHVASPSFTKTRFVPPKAGSLRERALQRRGEL